MQHQHIFKKIIQDIVALGRSQSTCDTFWRDGFAPTGRHVPT